VSSSDRVGITTTLPIEVILAAGRRPVDLNNRFVAGGRAKARVELAETRGFPRTVCSWVKGLYGTVLEEGITTVVGVTQGDCSLTHALLEVLQTEGVEVVRFEFPYARSEESLDAEIARLEATFGTDRSATERERASLVSLRADLARIDEAMAGCRGAGLASRAHGALLSGSDLDGGERERFESAVHAFADEIERSPAAQGPVRIALAGVPPIVDDLFEQVEEAGGRIVLSEMAREFAMVRRGQGSIVEQYAAYTYPYDVFYRADTLKAACSARAVEGVVHYVQSFCYRGVQDRIIRERIGLPVLTLECDRPGTLDGSSVTRLEAFVEMLNERRATTR
jgi:benzoyl-CoA reductase/2-hydroxyglutaryl-CoA dehydratase subunit BcrC/BadD/HgdB